MKKKILILIICMTILISTSIYFRNKSTYFIVRKYSKENINSHAIPSEIETENNIPKDEVIVKDNADIEEKIVVKTPEDIAMDKRINDFRNKNRELSTSGGMITGSPDRAGETRAPSVSEEELKEIFKPLREYISENPNLFSSNELINDMGLTIDPRFKDLIWGEEGEKLGLAEVYGDSNIRVLQARRLDGVYEEILVIRASDNSEWNIEYIGDYYGFRDKYK